MGMAAQRPFSIFCGNICKLINKYALKMKIFERLCGSIKLLKISCLHRHENCLKFPPSTEIFDEDGAERDVRG